MTDKRDRDLGLGRPITRRDFLNGVALTVGGSLIPAEMAAALAFDLPPGAQQKAGYYPPILTGLRGSHEGVVRSGPPGEGRHLLEGRGRARVGRRDLRPRGGGRRPQRARLGLPLPQGGRAGGPHPRARQPRRLRRPRQAQRVPPGRAHAPRPRRHLRDRQPGALQPVRQGLHPRPGHRRVQVGHRQRPQALRVPGHGPGRLLRQGDLRPRRADVEPAVGPARQSARSGPGSESLEAIRSRGPSLGRAKRDLERAPHREEGLPARASARPRRRPASPG